MVAEIERTPRRRELYPVKRAAGTMLSSSRVGYKGGGHLGPRDIWGHPQFLRATGQATTPLVRLIIMAEPLARHFRLS
jgi:hypothetical protein